MELKDVGDARELPGIELSYKKETLFVGQEKYVMNLLNVYGINENNTTKSSMNVNQKLRVDDESSVLLERLMHSSVLTTPDISFAISCLS